MIGVVDSGMGGENTVREIRRMQPHLNILLLKDTKNAPYGTKSVSELVKITEENIERLVSFGAESVLLACCTASTVWERLGKWHKEHSFPILRAVADEAGNVTECGCAALLATERTVASGAFKRLLPGMKILDIPAQKLVMFVERGERDRFVTRECLAYLEETLRALSGEGADTLILGCTHFPSLVGTISDIAEKYGVKYTVSSSLAGARTLLQKKELLKCESGVTVRI